MVANGYSIEFIHSSVFDRIFSILVPDWAQGLRTELGGAGKELGSGREGAGKGWIVF